MALVEKSPSVVADFYEYVQRSTQLGSVLSQCNADRASHVYLSKLPVNIITFSVLNP